ncbi:MAG: rhomboid family intramembrane serine protease [Acidobacteriota bacterium]
MESLFSLITLLIIIFQMLFTCIPLGNDRLSLKKLPLVTGIIIILNVVAFTLTMPFADWQDTQIEKARNRVIDILQRDPGLLAINAVKQKLVDAGWVQNNRLVTEEDSYSVDLIDEQTAIRSFGKSRADALVEKFNSEFASYEKAVSEHVYYQFGLAPNGKWKFPQLITHMFMHGGIMHLVGNMLFFFALGGALEERWGRGLFIVFYIFIGWCACLPYLIKPDHLPLIGASGAISGVMGAFAASMSKTRIKVGWLSIPLAIFFLLMKKKPFGIIRIPAYIVLGLYFIADYSSLITSRIDKEAMGGVAYLAHVSGFFFGVFFALIYESFNPIKKKLEVRNYALQPVVKNDDGETIASPVVVQAMEMLQRGEALKAQYKLKYYVVTNPYDSEAIKLLAHTSKLIGDFQQFNYCSDRLINQYLLAGDKNAALLVYMDLLSVLSSAQLQPQITTSNWMMICDYLRATGRNREAAIEYERLADTNTQDALAARACVQGGEAALSAYDRSRALKLFENALKMNPPESYQSRARRGIEMCQHILASHPTR